MPVEILPFIQQDLDMHVSIPAGAHVRLKPIPPNTVPVGCDATVEIDGIQFSVRDYRERPTHEAGAVISGDGITEKLSKKNPINAIGKNIFRYISATVTEKHNPTSEVG